MKNQRLKYSFPVLILALVIAVQHNIGGAERESSELFSSHNLVAWCIVPFDASKRTPAQRAEMLNELGFKAGAYDWRAEQIPDLETEILEYQKHGLEFFAFWGEHPSAFPLFEKHGLRPQIWKMLPRLKSETDSKKIDEAVALLRPLAEQCRKAGCKLGIYNHGGWEGEPANMIAIVEELRELGYTETGIVYNMHHGHDRIDHWSEDLALMTPYLLCVNINGMNRTASPKILTIGLGTEDQQMLQSLRSSKYRGRIGILNHTNRDAKTVLEENLAGLKQLQSK